MPLKLSQMIPVGLPTAQFGRCRKCWRRSLGGEIGQLAGAAASRSGARRDHPLELPADQMPARSPRARGRLHGRLNERGDPAQRLPLAEVIEQPAFPPVSSTSSPAPARSSASRSRPSRRRHGLLHRLDPGRQTRQRAGFGQRQAAGDGARRQVAERDPRTTPTSPGRSPMASPSASSTRPDLQRADPDAVRATSSPRPSRSPRRPPRPSPRRPVRRLDPARPARLRLQRQRVRGYIEKGEAEARSWSPVALRRGGTRPRLLRPPTVFSDVAPGR